MTPWTQAELDYEWRVCYETRIGILCEGLAPDKDQRWIAIREANEHVQALTEQN